MYMCHICYIYMYISLTSASDFPVLATTASGTKSDCAARHLTGTHCHVESHLTGRSSGRVDHSLNLELGHGGQGSEWLSDFGMLS